MKYPNRNTRNMDRAQAIATHSKVSSKLCAIIYREKAKCLVAFFDVVLKLLFHLKSETLQEMCLVDDTKIFLTEFS